MMAIIILTFYAIFFRIATYKVITCRKDLPFSQFYIQLVIKALPVLHSRFPTKKSWVIAYFWPKKNFPIFFFQFFLSNLLVRTLCDEKKIEKKILDPQNMKKSPQKFAYFSGNSVVSEIFLLLLNSPNGRIHVPKCGL